MPLGDSWDWHAASDGAMPGVTRLQRGWSILVLGLLQINMDSNQRLTVAASSPWLWLISCWGLRKQARAICGQLTAAQDLARFQKLEIDELKLRLQDAHAEHKDAKSGNMALINFIRLRHRLDVPITPDSVRGVLAQSERP